MQATVGFRLFVGSLALATCLRAPAQDLSVSDVISGTKLPSELKIADLSNDYKAVRLTLSSGGGGMSEMLGFFTSMSSMMGGPNSGSGAELMSMVGAYWTTGKVAVIGQQNYLVAYKLEANFAGMASAKSVPTVGLKLNLVRFDLLATIAPEPTFTKERLEKAIAGAKAMEGGLTSVEVEDVPVAQTAPPAPADAPMPSASSNDLNRVKQASLAVIMYASDYDDELPYVQSTGAAVEVTAPYIKNVSGWWTSDGRRVLFNMALAGVNTNQLEQPSGIVLLHAQPRADGSREVAFADGHVKLIGAEEWKKLSKTLNLKLKKSKRPLPASLGSKYNGAPVTE